MNEINDFLLIGLDLSIRSSGICIRIGENYTLLNLSDKIVKTVHPRIINKYYERTSSEFIHKDIKLGVDAENQAKEIIKIIDYYSNLYKIEKSNIIIGVEGISYGQSGSSSKYDIPITAGIIKNELSKVYNKENIQVYSPMTLKKALTGVGKGKKEVMINYYQKHIDPTLIKIRGVKIDDVIDAYACSQQILNDLKSIM